MVYAEIPREADLPGEGVEGVAAAVPPPTPGTPRSPLSQSLKSAAPPPAGDLTTVNMERLKEEQFEDPLFNTDKLRAVFDGMATNDRITLDQLPFVLVGSDIAATPTEIEDTIEQLLPDADDGDALIDYQQVEAVYFQLCHNLLDSDAPGINAPPLPTGPPSLAQWARRWLRRWHQHRQEKQTAYEKHMRPTTRLLLVILATASIISIAIVLFAVIYIFSHSVIDVQNHVLREVVQLKAGMELFGYTKPLATYTDQMLQLSSMLSTVTEELGYVNGKKSLREDLTFLHLLLGQLLDGWFVDSATNRAALRARLFEGCVQFLAQTESQSTAIAVMNQLNSALPGGHEVVLSRLGSSTGWPQYASKLRYRGQCQVANCTPGGHLDAASLAALNGSSGLLFGSDYRPTSVVAGYMSAEGAGLGVVYNMEQAPLQDSFATVVAATVNAINIVAHNGTTNIDGQPDNHEYVLAKRAATTGKTQIVTAERTCNSTCLQTATHASSVLALALNGSTGTADTKDLSGAAVTAAYGPLAFSRLALAVQMPEASYDSDLLASVATALDVVNRGFSDTREVQLAVADASSANGFRFLTAFTAACNGTCGAAPGTSPYLALAVANCSEGSLDSVLDYRGLPVVAGYSCVPSLKAGIAMTKDFQELLNNGVQEVGTLLDYVTNVRFADSTYEMIAARAKAGVQVVKSRSDFDLLNPWKLQKDCPHEVCTGPLTLMVEAFSGQTGVMKAVDYRQRSVYGAYAYVPSLATALVVKVDTSEAERDSIVTAGGLAGCCVAALICSMLLLGWLTSTLLRSMDDAWDEGKRAIEREKQQFRDVIEAMYPNQVAHRLLTGDTRIVYHVPNATVFFSDIYEFTTASNAITPDELIQFMGYTFGTMDVVADHYHIYKVKTMGDAYLGVAGLPGSASLSGNAALDVLTFASCCAQLFSTRYLHPDHAAVLGTVAQALFGSRDKRKKAVEDTELQRLPTSTIQYTNPSMPNGAVEDPDSPGVQCVMRYGVASGPITAGVLQGKTPLFDIWGKTVNLASRMESSGVPGRIHISESAFVAVSNVPDQPFTFDGRHRVMCKGFGSVNAYFINSCKLPPPKALLVSRHIQPNLGRFFFDNAVAGFRSSSKTGSSAHASSADRHSKGDPVSPRSSAASGPELGLRV